MQKTVNVCKGNMFYINIPNDIAKKINLQQGEIALIKVIDNDTLEIKIIED